ncbi:MAG: MarR family transcriptional regulator [Candidatus Omnitrophica bacterium]|nr:MarR family transcriptional regulator [Candidatus Omnitrophota bacterium]
MKDVKLTKTDELNHEVLVGMLRTSSMLLRISDRFFSRFDVTHVQFNILMILKYDDLAGEGLSQNQIGTLMVVTKSNVVGLVDRLEKAGYVIRKNHPEDRRINRVMLTAKGKKKLEDIEHHYFAEINRLMSSLSNEEKKAMMLGTDKIRQYLGKNWEGKNQ